MTEIVNAKPYHLQNRELSWLKFNERVLQEANRVEIPLLDRLKFISIFSSNLDEFFRVRVGALTAYSQYNKEYIDNKTGMTAREQLNEIYHAVVPLYALRENAFSTIVENLAHHDIHLLKMKDLNSTEIKELKSYFLNNVKPILSPAVIDTSHPMPRFMNKQLNIAVTLESKKGYLFGVIPVPVELERLVPVSGKGYRFVTSADLIYHFTKLVFTNYKVVAKNILTATRSADINTDDGLVDGVDYRLHMKTMLKKRRNLSLVRLEVAYPVSNQAYVKYFCDRLGLDLSQILYSSFPLDFTFGFTLEHYLDRETAKRLLRPVYRPAETLPADEKKNMVKVLERGDMMLSYPFESMSPFLELLRQSADDDATISIKITLYRIDTLSQVAEALVRAVENGKEVVVLMELRARFDEGNNIEWAQRLEEAGCRVIYGLVGYKVHSKVCLITRREFGKIQYITQVGTGNYNEKTARQYTDISLLTTNQEIGDDVSSFFANLLLGNLAGSYKHLWVAPGNLKRNLFQFIEKEEEKAKSGLGGSIIIKCNSLTDKDIIEKLVRASQNGVKIFLIVRGICCLIPQIKGQTENICVVSIVGKFLEHSRVYCFGDGSDRQLFISSADLMTRNTEQRVEVACPILDSALKDRLYRMLEVMLTDNAQAWEQCSDGRYIRRYSPANEPAISSQELFAEETPHSIHTIPARCIHTQPEPEKDANSKSIMPLLKRVKQAAKLIFLNSMGVN